MKLNKGCHFSGSNHLYLSFFFRKFAQSLNGANYVVYYYRVNIRGNLYCCRHIRHLDISLVVNDPKWFSFNKTGCGMNIFKVAKSSFAVEYNNGNIPCRLNHGSVKHKLEWKVDIGLVPMDPTLVLLATGLPETSHPYTFLSEVGFRGENTLQNGSLELLVLWSLTPPPPHSPDVSRLCFIVPTTSLCLRACVYVCACMHACVLRCENFSLHLSIKMRKRCIAFHPKSIASSSLPPPPPQRDTTNRVYL